MSDSKNGLFDYDLDRLANLANSMKKTLAEFGIDLPLFEIQLAILVLAVIVLFVLILKYRPQIRKLGLNSLSWLLPGAILFLAVAFIGSHWLYQVCFPLPGELSGQVVMQGYRDDVSVHLEDLGDASISGAGFPIDTQTGRFVVTYHAPFGDRPRKLVVQKVGCEKRAYPVGWSDVWARQMSPINYNCTESGK